MELTVKKKIGKETHTFIVSGKNLHELVMETQKLSFGDVETCGICKSDNLSLIARLAQGKFKYVDVKCNACRGSLTFGSTQENPDVYYLRRDDATKELAWKEYKKD